MVHFRVPLGTFRLDVLVVRSLVIEATGVTLQQTNFEPEKGSAGDYHPL